MCHSPSHTKYAAYQDCRSQNGLEIQKWIPSIRFAVGNGACRLGEEASETGERRVYKNFDIPSRHRLIDPVVQMPLMCPTKICSRCLVHLSSTAVCTLPTTPLLSVFLDAVYAARDVWRPQLLAIWSMDLLLRNLALKHLSLSIG